jgi:Pyruvate/2-oxoacid:ferredoxin oxidoreductase delta subunit
MDVQPTRKSLVVVAQRTVEEGNNRYRRREGGKSCSDLDRNSQKRIKKNKKPFRVKILDRRLLSICPNLCATARSKSERGVSLPFQDTGSVKYDTCTGCRLLAEAGDSNCPIYHT